MYGVWHVPTAATISPIFRSSLQLTLARQLSTPDHQLPSIPDSQLPACCPGSWALGVLGSWQLDVGSCHVFIALSAWSNSAMVGTTLSALDSGCRPSRMA